MNIEYFYSYTPTIRNVLVTLSIDTSLEQFNLIFIISQRTENDYYFKVPILLTTRYD